MYNFTKMEWWRNRNKDGLGHAYIGYCENGDVYLTFDVRKEGNKYVPVFSSFCKVGSKSGHKEEAYHFYREQFGTLEGYQIQTVNDCNFRDIHEIDNLYTFEI